MGRDDQPEEATIVGWLARYGLEPIEDGLDCFDLVSPELAAEVRSGAWRRFRAVMAYNNANELSPDYGPTVEMATKLAIRYGDIDGTLQGLPELDPRMTDGPRTRSDRVAFAYEQGDVLVSGVARERDGRLVLRSIAIEDNPVQWRQGAPPGFVDGPVGGGLTSAHLRGVSITTVLARLRREMADAPKWVEAEQRLTPSIPLEERELVSAATLSELEASTNPQSGRRRADAFYRAVAVVYLEEQAAGRGVYRRLAERFAPRPEATIRSWVKAAEERGFLTSGTRGRQDREPGPRLAPNDNQENQS